MPVELLKKISKKTLPLTINDIESIDKLRVLSASGHVEAVLPRVDDKNPCARVLGITQLGQEALHNFQGPGS